MLLLAYINVSRIKKGCASWAKLIPFTVYRTKFNVYAKCIPSERARTVDRAKLRSKRKAEYGTFFGQWRNVSKFS